MATFATPALPYSTDALAPWISQETLELHSGRHHKAYVDNLNGLVAGTEFENLSLEEIVRTAGPGAIFNNAAQVWNHTFYFESLIPPAILAKNRGRHDLTTEILASSEEIYSAPKHGTAFAAAFEKKWDHFDDFRKEFKDVALKTFGSGWAWLVKKPDGTLAIVSTSNAGTPITGDDVPLLTCDVWEHAYYVDYRNRRAEYVDKFWHVVNWDKVAERYDT